MNPQQRIVASLTIVFVMLFAAIGASFVSRSGAQAANTQAAVDLGNRLDPGTTITPGTTPGTTVGTTSPPPTPKKHPIITPPPPPPTPIFTTPP
jgi:hypothetical protein